jgi:hypothetical protein
VRRWGLWLALCALPGCYVSHHVDDVSDAGAAFLDDAGERPWCAARHDLEADPCFATEAECRATGAVCYDARWYER